MSSPIPDPSSPHPSTANPAVDLIRQKITNLYSTEPNAREELSEASRVPHRSKHQQYMYDLSRSGKSLADIQIAWHEYYQSLPDHEKHEVWREFYSEHSRQSEYAKKFSQPAQPAVSQPVWTPVTERQPVPGPLADPRTPSDIRKQLIGRVQSNSSRRISGREHVKSLLFGLGIGSIVLVIFMFSFFNERFLAPFMTPSRSVSNAPIIIDPSNTAVTNEPKLIVPKINLDVPVVFTEKSIEEDAVQKALENGVLHYGTTPYPGEIGNAVIFGHSSNNILNKGKYKFAFVLLSKLETGDTFMIQREGKRYVYKVYEKKVVKPEEISVLNPPSDKKSVATLITCDPPGTSTNRLVVTGEQISPSPDSNVASSVNIESAKPTSLPSNSITLWQRIKNWL